MTVGELAKKMLSICEAYPELEGVPVVVRAYEDDFNTPDEVTRAIVIDRGERYDGSTYHYPDYTGRYAAPEHNQSLDKPKVLVVMLTSSNDGMYNLKPDNDIEAL